MYAYLWKQDKPLICNLLRLCWKLFGNSFIEKSFVGKILSCKFAPSFTTIKSIMLMTKGFVSLLIAGCSMTASAQNLPPTNGDQINLSVSIVDPYGDLGHGHPKGPVRPPHVPLADHTLYIWSQHGGYTLTLLADDTVVYQTFVSAGTQMVSLPPTLSGSYTLQLSNDTYLFTGVIDLE